MARRSSVGGALGRPPFVAVLGVLALLLVVWASAAPRGSLDTSAGVGLTDPTRADSPDFVLGSGCWLCLSPGAGSDVTTGDGIGAVLGWASVAPVVAGALVCLALILRALAPLPASRTSSEVSMEVLGRFIVDPEQVHTLAARCRTASAHGETGTVEQREHAQSPNRYRRKAPGATTSLVG